MSHRRYAIHKSYEGITLFFGWLSRLFKSRALSKSLTSDTPAAAVGVGGR